MFLLPRVLRYTKLLCLYIIKYQYTAYNFLFLKGWLELKPDHTRTFGNRKFWTKPPAAFVARTSMFRVESVGHCSLILCEGNRKGSSMNHGIFHVHPGKMGKMNPFWQAYFFRWVAQPPTRLSFTSLALATFLGWFSDRRSRVKRVTNPTSGPKNSVSSGQNQTFWKKQRTKKSIQRKRKNSSSPAFSYWIFKASGPASPKRSEPECCDTTGEKKNATGQDKAIHKFPFKGTILLWEMHVNPTLYGLFSGGFLPHTPPYNEMRRSPGIILPIHGLFVRR